jgi:carboxypeptidase C (cathepsin A)
VALQEINNYLMEHIQPSGFCRNVATGCYLGGHMMYDNQQAYRQLKNDAAFLQSAVR